MANVKIMADVIGPNDEHWYWSTHCRHGRHVDCTATELAPGVPRRPAQCKTCAAPCQCYCHQPATQLPDSAFHCPSCDGHACPDV